MAPAAEEERTASEPPPAQANTIGTAAPAIAYGPMGGTSLEAVVSNLRGVLTLNASAIQEVRANAALTVPAVLIAAAAIAVTGFGAFLSYVIGYADYRGLFASDGQQLPSEGEFFIKTVVVGSLLGGALWLASTGVSTAVLRYLLRRDLQPGEVFRVAGFATAPLAIGALLFIPGLGFGFGLLSVGLLLAFTTLVIEKAFDAPPEKALAATLAGVAIWTLVVPLFVSGDNPFGPGVFVFDWSHDWGLDLLGRADDLLYQLGS